MNKIWITKNNIKIPYCELELSHLKHIIKYIEKVSHTGLTIQCGGCGSTADEMWYDEDIIYGNEVFDKFDYIGLKKELNNRNKILE